MGILMPDIPPIQGPAQHPDQLRRNERSSADADKFKQEMLRKQSQISETDPDQKKKRKQQSEDQEGLMAPAPQAEPAPATPLQQESSPLKISSTSSTSLPTTPSPAPPIGPPTSVPDDHAVPTGIQTTSSSAPKDKESNSDSSKSSQTSEPSEESPTPTAPFGKHEALHKTKMHALPVAPSVPGSAPLPPSTTAEEEKEEEATQAIAPIAGSPDKMPTHPSKKHEAVEAVHGAPPPPPALLSTHPAGLPPPPAAYTSLSLPVMDLFEKMVGTMTVMTDSKMTETTVTLSSPRFATSIFYGTQIVIREYTSAPKVFNIQLNGHPEAVAAFKGNADALMAAFQYGNYSFRVNRLDTGLLSSERPLFRRKEKASDDTSDHSEEGT